MQIKELLSQLQNVKYFAVSRDRYEKSRLIEWFGQVAESNSDWLIPCAQNFFEPSHPHHLSQLASWFKIELPKELEDFYLSSNGAELFKIKYKSTNMNDYWHVRYEIFNIEQLLEKNRGIYQSFRSQLRPKSRYWDITKLNYFAFCSVGDGSYLAVSLDPSDNGTVFFLDQEYGFLPYGIESTRDAYPRIASSFTKWLTILIKTYGEGGTGVQWIPL